MMPPDCLSFTTTDMNDVIGWKWEKSNKILVKSMYITLTSDDNVRNVEYSILLMMSE